MKQSNAIPQFSKVQHWAAQRGFELGDEHQDGYPLEWHDPDGNKRAESVPDLADVEPFITGLIERREAAVPGEWYLHWWVEDREDWGEPWSPYPRWIVIQVQEGILDRVGILNQVGGILNIEAIRRRFRHRPLRPPHFDLNAYPSPEAALAQVPLLPLETGAQPRLRAFVGPLFGDSYRMRVPGVTEAMMDEYTLLCLRYYATYNGPGASGWLDGGDELERIAEQLQKGTGMHPSDAQDSIGRLIAQGTQVRRYTTRPGIYIDNPTPKRWWTYWNHWRQHYDHNKRPLDKRPKGSGLTEHLPDHLEVWIRKLHEGEDPGSPSNTYYRYSGPRGYDGPFDTEEQARENVAGYSLRHGIPVGAVYTQVHRVYCKSWYDKKKEWGDWKPRPGIRSRDDGDFPMKPAPRQEGEQSE